MRIKTRLTLWLGLVTFLVLVLATIALATIWNLRTGTRDVLKANYNSISYAQAMLEAVDATPVAVDVLHAQLALQNKNITEPGEEELSQHLGRSIERFVSTPDDPAQLRAVRGDLHAIIEINRAAIERKANAAELRAETAFTWISIAGTLCFLIAFTLFLSLPERLADPIRKLTEGIDRIAQGRYAERVVVQDGSEFSHMADRFNTMAGELERWQSSNLARVLEEKARAEAVINSLEDASIGLDEQGRILFINRQAMDLLGLKEDISGRSAVEMAANNDLLRHVLNDRSGAPMKIVVDGKEQYFASASSAITGANGPLGTVITLHNITPFQERDQAKTHFLATISHELKTPLASTDIGLGLLERTTSLGDEQKAILNDLRKDHQRLVRIVSELLDMAQVESGRIRMELGPQRLMGLVHDALTVVHVAAEQKHIRFEQTPVDPEVLVIADAARATWALVNVLANAVRHSPVGGTIDVRCGSTDHQVNVTIADHGAGFDAQVRDRLFQRFAAGATSDQRTGLGLSIARDVMVAMGGGIELVDQEQEGATLRLTFQRA